MSDVNTNKTPKVTSINRANRSTANTNHSTGPRTPEGKNKACQNTVKHGCTVSIPVVNGRVPPEVEARIVLPDEDPADWEALKATWHEAYQPQTELHISWVLQAVIADWLMRRTLRNYNEIHQKLSSEQPDITAWTDEQHAILERFNRYHVKAERAYQRARKAVESVRLEHKLDAEKAQLREQTTPRPGKLEKAPPLKSPSEESLTADSTEGAVQLLPRPLASLIQCITVQVLDGQTSTLFQPRSENLTQMILNAPEPKPVIKRAIYFLDGIPEEYEWITEYESYAGRPHFVLTRTSLEALQDLEKEREDGSGHVLPVSLVDDHQD